ETTYKGFGALKIGGVSDFDDFLEFLDDDEMDVPKIKGVRLQTSDDFTQKIGGQLRIAQKGLVGSLPYYSLGGFSADESLYYNSISNTLSVPRVLLSTSSLLLSPNDAVSKHYLDNYLKVMYPLQKVVDELSLQVDKNSLQVGALGLAVNTAEFGGLKITPGVGVGVSVDNMTIQIGADGMLNGNYRAMYPVQLSIGTNEISLQYDELTMKTGANGLTLNLFETDRGLQIQTDGLGIWTQQHEPIKSGYNGLYLQLSPDDSCLMKSTTGLELAIAVDSPFIKEPTGLDLRVGTTLKKTTLGLEGNYMGESPDITVTGNMIVCNIDVGGKGLQKVGSIISLLPDVEDKLDQVDDMVDNLDDLGDRLDNVAENLSNIAEQVMSTAAQIGTAAAAGAVGGGISSGLALTAAGKLAKDGVQSLISANAAKVTGGGLAAASLAGILGGLLGSLGGKKTYNTYIIGDQGISNSGVPEGGTEPVWGYSISQGYNFNTTLYPNK
ncbi:hypothetical protein HK097_001171, partial [Rhizophlyctis rosea]